MIFRRIGTIYRKELADVLRDRRTLIATIVIPVVLYPLLMLVSLQAVSVQTAHVAAEKIVVGFESTTDRGRFLQLMADASTANAQHGQAKDHDENKKAGYGHPAAQRVTPSSATQKSEQSTQRKKPQRPLVDMIQPRIVDDLSAAVRDKSIQVGVTIEPEHHADDSLSSQVRVRLFFQPDQLRSQSAATRIQHALERLADMRVRQRLAALHVDTRTIEPIVLKKTTLSTPGSLLSLVLPLVLVLMTITAAIYPAIDLTAGEYERGTLETLMVCPVPTIELVVGKFLTVTTIAILGATLNLGSVATTVYFGGLGKLLAAGAGGMSVGSGGFPLAAIPIILISLVPFSVLMAAILIAVCGFARSFKEAQNYMTPVMVSVLLPALAGSLPGARLGGLMLVLPVGNIVLLLRELLSGAGVGAWAFLAVILSTSVYAAAAVAAAAQVFGKESVVFADNVSLRSLLSRRQARPSALPPLAMASLYVALLFPVWFYVQTAIQDEIGSDFAAVLAYTAVFMPLLFVALPAGLMGYWKVDIVETLRLRLKTSRDREGAIHGTSQPAHHAQNAPSRSRLVGRFFVAAILFGLTMWVAAQEIFLAQQAVLPAPSAFLQLEKPMAGAIKSLPFWAAVLVVAVIPAISEELLFRGFLLSGLRSSLRKWPAILITSAAFAAFHVYLFKFSTTFALGVILAWLCWRSASIYPGMIAHALNNGVGVFWTRYPEAQMWLGINPHHPTANLPWPVLAGAGVLLLIAWALVRQWGDGGCGERVEG